MKQPDDDLMHLAHEAAPSGWVSVHKGGKVCGEFRWGDEYAYYDWASLTKIVFSITATMRACDERKLQPNLRLAEVLPWLEKTAFKKTLLREILSHSAGLEWWKPYYKKIPQDGSPEERWLALQKLLHRDIGKMPRPRAPIKSVYSDLDFFVLAEVLQEVFQLSLRELWQQQRERLGFHETDFHLGNKPLHARKLYAPTEDSPWRGGVLQGEVHDENTWALGGIAPHSGLFGPMEELVHWGLLLRKAMRGEDARGFATAKTARLFTRRAIPRARGDWALGFMLPALKGSSCGRHFSKLSVGHLGFTGTSIWFDPKQDLLVAILTNRVCPTRDNRKIAQLRPALHDWVASQV